MACSNSTNKCNAKSCVRYYNNNSQPLTATSPLQLTIAGSRVVDTGTAIDVQPQSYTTNRVGLYHLTGDVVINATTAGDVTFQVYMDGVALPCTLKTVTLADGYNAIHTETDLALTACCSCVSHTFTYAVTSAGALGNVVEFCSGILKEA